MNPKSIQLMADRSATGRGIHTATISVASDIHCSTSSQHPSAAGWGDLPIDDFATVEPAVSRPRNGIKAVTYICIDPAVRANHSSLLAVGRPAQIEQDSAPDDQPHVHYRTC